MVEGDTLLVPVIVDSSLTGEGILALEMELNFSSFYFELVSISASETMLNGWSVTSNTNFDDRVLVVAAGSEELTGTGTLFYVGLKALRSGGSSLNFNADNTLLNEGGFDLIFDSGYISITARPQISVSNSGSQLVVGDSLQYSVTGAEEPITWSTTNPAVAEISDQGMMKAIGYGNVEAIAEDNRGIRDTSSIVKVFGFRIAGTDTTNFQGQTVTVDINTTDLTSLGVRAGEFRLNSNIAGQLEVLAINKGELLSEGAELNTNVSANSISVVFAQTEDIIGEGNLISIDFKLNENSTTYNSFSFEDIIFNEDVEGIGSNFIVRGNALPSLSISPGSGDYMVGDSVTFSVSNNTGSVVWSVPDDNVAEIDSLGLLRSLSGGTIQVTAEDSLGANSTTSNFNFFDVKLVMADTSMLGTDTLLFPIHIENIEESSSSVLSSEIEFTYNHNYVQYLGFETESSLSEGWSYSASQISEGRIKIVGAGSNAIESSGEMVYIKFKADTSVSTDVNAYMNLEEVLLNEGKPTVTTGNGNIFVSQKPLVPELTAPANGKQNVFTSGIKLDWNNAVGADSYDVQLSTSSSFVSFEIDTTGVLTEDLDLPDLSESTTYYWRVRSVNESGFSDWSIRYSFRTVDPVPDAPSLSSPANGSEDVSLSTVIYWSSVTYADSFRVEVDTSANFSSVIVDSSLTNTNMLVPDLEYGTTYYWRVFAFNENGESISSEEWNFTTDDGLPDVPLLASPANNATDVDTLITFSWQASADADSYRLQLSNDSLFAATVVDSLTTELTMEGPVLKADSTYYWRVRAENEVGASNWNTRQFATITDLPLTPVLLSPENGLIDADTALVLTWSEAERAEEYNYQVSIESDFSSTIIDDSTIDTNTDIFGLGYLDEYFWRVKSFNSSGESEWSSVFSFTTREKDNELPVVSNNLGAIEIEEDFESFVAADLDTVFTDPEGGELSFEIIEFSEGLFEASLSSNLLSITSLNDQYGSGEVMVRAVDGSGGEAFDTLFVQVLPVNDPPRFVGIPDTLVIQSDEELTVSLDTSIVDIEDALNDLSVSVEVEPLDIILEFDEAELSVTLSAPEFEGEGSLTITVTDTDGATAVFTIVVIVEMVTSTDFSDGIPDKFSLLQNYPNPFNPTTEIGFNLPNASEVTIEIFSMLGQKVATVTKERYNAGNHTISFDAASLSSGMYIYRIRAGNFVQTKKMTLIK
jgi:hypothetical protein